MAAAHNQHRSWDFSHNPGARPLGCNGKYGDSGYKKHKRAGEDACGRCLKSKAHNLRERRRGAGRIPRPLHPCGTPAAARGHYRHNEPLDLACKVAHTNYQTELNRKKS